MITLQEQFEKDFPDKSVREINTSLTNACRKYKKSSFTNWNLDLRGYKDLEDLYIGSISLNLTSVNLSENKKWINALTTKITQTELELQETKTNLPEKVKRMQRLEDKLNNLTVIKNLLEELSIEKDHSQDINNRYQRQLNGENAQRRSELWNLILELKWNSRQKDQQIQQLKENVEISNKILEVEKKETSDKEIQTELTGESLEQQKWKLKNWKNKLSN